MWAQTWESISDLVKPFPTAPGFDVTEKLKEVSCLIVKPQSVES